MSDEVAAVIVQYPNFFGRIEPLKDMEKIVHQAKICLLFLQIH